MTTVDDLMAWALDLFPNALINEEDGELVIWTGVRNETGGRLSVIDEIGVDLDFSIDDLFAWVNEQFPDAIVRPGLDDELAIWTGFRLDRDGSTLIPYEETPARAR
jgi:hypothetical protein